MTKKLIFIGLLLGSLVVRAHAQGVSPMLETWTVEGKVFTSRAQAVRYIVASGKRVSVKHERCEILTNKLTFKACPKNKQSSFDNEQFESIHATK